MLKRAYFGIDESIALFITIVSLAFSIELAANLLIFLMLPLWLINRVSISPVCGFLLDANPRGTSMHYGKGKEWGGGGADLVKEILVDNDVLFLKKVTLVFDDDGDIEVFRFILPFSAHRTKALFELVKKEAGSESCEKPLS